MPEPNDDHPYEEHTQVLDNMRNEIESLKEERDELKAIVKQGREILAAVTTDIGYAQCNDMSGVNWFDARDAFLLLT